MYGRVQEVLEWHARKDQPEVMSMTARNAREESVLCVR
jgi:hypothetical protein